MKQDVEVEVLARVRNLGQAGPGVLTGILKRDFVVNTIHVLPREQTSSNFTQTLQTPTSRLTCDITLERRKYTSPDFPSRSVSSALSQPLKTTLTYLSAHLEESRRQSAELH